VISLCRFVDRPTMQAAASSREGHDDEASTRVAYDRPKGAKVLQRIPLGLRPEALGQPITGRLQPHASVLNELDVLDFGPFFDSEGGVQTLLPPVHGPRYTVLVPRPRADGDGEAGIDTMWTRAPLGTNVGWNVRAGVRAPDLCFLSGSFIPFAKTKAERLSSGDSRKSLKERYKDHRGFVKAVENAAKQLVKERFLLEEDAETFIRAAEASDVLK
jgi:Alpha/beta hydrolase domain